MCDLHNCLKKDDRNGIEKKLEGVLDFQKTPRFYKGRESTALSATLKSTDKSSNLSPGKEDTKTISFNIDKNFEDRNFERL